MSIISFDLEIAKPLPEGCKDWREHSPLGISCAMLYGGDTKTFLAHGKLLREHCGELVDTLLDHQRRGDTIVTVNGCSFDFHVLAEESGRLGDCAELAWNHCDLMLLATFQKGWMVGLDSMLAGHGLQSKQHIVRLSDGTVIENMNGAMAPELWQRGEIDAVLEYLRGDVARTHELAEQVLACGKLKFVSRAGKSHYVDAAKLYTVREMMEFPKPDVSWMDSPPTRESFVAWTGDKNILKIKNNP